MSQSQNRNKTRSMTGKVVGTGMQSTVKVEVLTPMSHPVYKKMVPRSKTYMVHTESELEVGDLVEIKGTSPRSKNIRWVVTKKIDR